MPSNLSSDHRYPSGQHSGVFDEQGEIPVEALYSSSQIGDSVERNVMGERNEALIYENEERYYDEHEYDQSKYENDEHEYDQSRYENGEHEYEREEREEEENPSHVTFNSPHRILSLSGEQSPIQPTQPTQLVSSSLPQQTPSGPSKQTVSRQEILQGMAKAQSILARASQPVERTISSKSIESIPVSNTVTESMSPGSLLTTPANLLLPTTSSVPTPFIPSSRYEELDRLQRETGIMLPTTITNVISQESPLYTESELRRRVLQAENRGKEKGKQLVETVLVVVEKLEEENMQLKEKVTVLEEAKQNLESYSEMSRRM